MIIDGKKIAADIRSNIKAQIDKIVPIAGSCPKLTVILVGDDPASVSYVKGKEKACAEVGIITETIRLPSDTSEETLIDKIDDLNYDSDVSGILVQLPLPKHIDVQNVINRIFPEKDVDGFTAVNLGKMLLEQECFIPCTPNGIMKLIESMEIDLNGKNVAVIGRSNIVGKPIVNLLSRKANNATVTWCHTGTSKEKLYDSVLEADVVVVATGCPKTFDYHYMKPGAVLVDVGISRIEDASKKNGFRLVGDVYDSADEEMKRFFDANKISYTPVPGGVGPMTIAMLCYNTFQAYIRSMKVQ